MMAALPPDLMGWSVEDVKQWAMEVVGIDAEDADKLAVQKIDGRHLLKMTEARLLSIGISLAAAVDLMEAIEGLGGGGGSSSVTGELCRARILR